MWVGFWDIDEAYGIANTSPSSFPPLSLCRHGSPGKEAADSGQSETEKALVGTKMLTFTVTFIYLCHGSFQLLGKKDLRQRQIKKPKYSTFHFTSWLGYLEVADGRVVSYQLTKFLSGLQFACIEKTVGYVNPVQGGEHYSSWKRLWSLMWHKLYLALSRDNHWCSLLHYQLEKLPLNQMIWGESERGQLGFFLLWNQNTS